jgi:hypothetical protein
LGVVFYIRAGVAFGIGYLPFVLDETYAGVLAKELGSKRFRVGFSQGIVMKEGRAGLRLCYITSEYKNDGTTRTTYSVFHVLPLCYNWGETLS